MSRRAHPCRGYTAVPYLIGIALLAMVALAGCAPTTEHSLPPGWTWHRDTTFPITVPVPPGWRANAYWADFFQGAHCTYALDLIPTVSNSLYVESPPGGREPELIDVAVNIGGLGCSTWTPTDNKQLASHARAMTISGAQATLYDGQPDIAGIVRLAIAHFGSYQYQFGFDYDYRPETPAANGPQQLALFMQVLRDFEYTGK